MYARSGMLNVIVCAPRVIPMPGETYPTVAGKRCASSRPPMMSRRGVPYASAPRFTDRPRVVDTIVLTPMFASQESGADHGTVETGDRITFVVFFGTSVYGPPPYR